MMFASNPAGSKYSEDLVFAPSDLKSDKVLVSGVITLEDKSELTKLSKKAKIVDIDKVERFAELYNSGLAWREIVSAMGYKGNGSLSRIRQQAERHMLLDPEQRKSNKAKKEEEQRMAVIKAKHVQGVCKPDLPEIEAKAEDLRVAGNISGVDTQPEPTPESDPIDVDAIIAEMEAAARDASQMLMLTEDHRDAAAQVVRILGAERAAEIVKAIHQQLKRELAAIWRQEAM
jgi:hypothetical protein